MSKAIKVDYEYIEDEERLDQVYDYIFKLVEDEN